MFCLMDVSASMGERKKDLAKRFFMLLHLFLKRQIQARRHRLHPPHLDGPGGRRADVLLRPRDRRHGGLDRRWRRCCAIARDALSRSRTGTSSARRPPTATISAGDSAALRGPAGADDPADRASISPISRSPTPRASPTRRWRQGIVARLLAEAAPAHPNFALRRVAEPRRHLSRFPRAVRQARQGAASADRPDEPCPRCAATIDRPKLLFEGAEWDFDTLQQRLSTRARRSRVGELGLDVYPNQIEIISAEQMLDAYSSVGMPLMYPHWSFGKRFARDEALYRKGYTALAYEIVINSNPCISYIMEENTMAMQTLVIAHAAFGHNHFFKNNYLFQQWTDARRHSRLSRLRQALCRRMRGALRRSSAVERMLDAAHALMDQGVFRYPRARSSTSPSTSRRRARRLEHEEQDLSAISGGPCRRPRRPRRSRTYAERLRREAQARARACPRRTCSISSRRTPRSCDGWQRELLRIVRNVAQYFYPQRQTKMMNEGCATFVHYEIMNRLYDKGLITEGAMLEILHRTPASSSSRLTTTRATAASTPTRWASR